MTDVCTYIITICGRIDAADLASMSQTDLKIVSQAPTGLTFSLHTDQSGLIGLLRLLHARGVVFDSIKRSFPLPPAPALSGSKGRG